MKKLNRLTVIEADPSLEPLLAQHQSLLQLFSVLPVEQQFMSDGMAAGSSAMPQLVLLHTNLTHSNHLQVFIELQNRLPFTTIIIVGQQRDEELCLLAVEAGAEDSITDMHLTPEYLRKAVVVALRRSRNQMETARSKEQLTACIQNTPNVAVQWYNSKAEVLFWNKASEAIFGWTAAEAIGKTLSQLISTIGDQELWENKIKHILLADVAPEPQEWGFHYRDGSDGCCISTLFPIPSFTEEPWFVCMDVDITERKRMEKDLQKSKENYHTLFNQASDAIFINDDAGRFSEVNQKAYELLGYPKEQLLRMRVTDLYSKEELAVHPIMWKELLAGERTSLERNMIHAGGNIIPVEVTAQRFDDGRIMAIVRDVSERKKAEEDLVRSEEKYRSLVEQQADAITIFDNRGRILEVNTSAMQLLSYSRQEFQGLTLPDILSDEDIKTAPVDFDALLNGTATIKQRKMRRKDGILIETEVHTKRLQDGHFLASVRDLTERIEVQRQLEREKGLSDSIINSLPGLFYLFTKEGRYLRWNKQLQIISGYNAGEISDMGPLDYFDEAEKTAVQASINKVFQEGQSAIEANLLTKDGRKVPYYFTGIAIMYGGTDCLLGTGIDLSVMKNLEKELSQQKIAEQKKVMQAMIETQEKEKNKLGLELHDNVNQILAVVRMYLTILDSDQIPEGISLAKTGQLLNTAIDEIRNLSHSLAVSYRFESGLTEAVEDMIEMITLTKDFTVTFTAVDNLDERTESTQKLALYRIIQEQLSNIIKHAKATEVEVQVDMTPDEIELTIHDNGKGFDPATTEKGLGMNNIINRAEALDGTVSIQSAPGKGCRIIVTMPLQKKS